MKRAGELPIDRGWAWVVMIAVSCNLMIIVGYVRSFGIFFPEFIRIFKASSSMTASIVGVQSAVVSVAGFIAQNILTDYFSGRVIVITGGVLTSIGIICSRFAYSVPTLIATQSLFTGLGYAFILGPQLVLVNQYFDKHRSLATSVAQVGANVGSIALPPLIRYLIDEYGLKGTFLIYGGLMLNVVAFGSLLKPLDSFKSNRKRPTARDENDHEDATTEDERSEKEEARQFLPEQDTEKLHPNIDTRRENEDNFNIVVTKRERSTNPQSSVLKYGSMEGTACISVDDVQSKEHTLESPKRNFCIKYLDKFLDFSLFTKAKFYLIIFVGSLAVLGNVVMGTYIPAFAADKGISKYAGAALLSANSAAGIFSKVGIGFFADRNIMKRHHILALALFITAVSGLLAPLYNSYWSLMLFSLIFGFFGVLHMTLLPVIIVDFLGLEKLRKTLGFLQLVQGGSMAVSHPIAGMLRDVDGSFDASYQFFGSGCLVAFVLMLLEPCARRCDERRQKNPAIKAAVQNDTSHLAP